MDDKPIGRAEFFKYLFNKAASTAFQVAEDVVEPLKKAGEVAQAVVTSPLIPVEQYQDKPQLIISSKPPVFLAGTIGKNLTAFSAICPKDGFILTYLQQEDVLYCSACNSKHALVYEDAYVTTDLQTILLSIREGFIHVLK